MQSNTEVCRICFENDGILISPCECRGESKWIHEKCLTRWRTSAPLEESSSRCEICLTDYNIPIRISLCRYVHDLCWDICIPIFQSFFYLNVILSLLGAVTYLVYAIDSTTRYHVCRLFIDIERRRDARDPECYWYSFSISIPLFLLVLSFLKFENSLCVFIPFISGVVNFVNLIFLDPIFLIIKNRKKRGNLLIK